MAEPRRAASGAAVALLVLLPSLGGCFGSTSYCEQLKQDRSHLAALAKRSNGTGASARTAFSESVTVLSKLGDKAPDDIAQDWDTLLGALRGLASAIKQSGAAPADFASGKRPPGVTAGQYAAVEQAAAELQATAVQQAGQSIEQHARDVCKVDLGSGLGGAG